MELRINERPGGLFRFAEKSDNEDFLITETLEKVSYEEYLYRELKNEGYKRIVFVSYGADGFAFVCYDAFSFWTYRYAFDFEDIELTPFDTEEQITAKAKDIIDDIKSHLSPEQYPAFANGKYSIMDAGSSGNIRDEIIELWSVLLKDENIQTAFVIDLDWAMLTKENSIAEAIKSIYDAQRTRSGRAVLNKIIFMLPGSGKAFEDSINYLKDNGFDKLISMPEGKGSGREFKDSFFKESEKREYRGLYFRAPQKTDELLKRLIVYKDIMGQLDFDIDYSLLPKYISAIRKAEEKSGIDYLLSEIDVLLSNGGIDLAKGDGETKGSEIIPQDLAQKTKKAVFGQSEHIDTIVKALVKRFNKNIRSRAPLSFMNFGVTGIGKTECFKVMSDIINREGSEKWGFIHIPLNQYTEKSSAARLLGSDQGYVGYGDKTPLDDLDGHKYNIVVFDEFEKAHEDIWQVIMSMIDTDGYYESKALKKRISYLNTVFVFTSNVSFDRKTYLTLDKREGRAFLTKALIKELSKKSGEHVAAPVIGRIGEMMCFNPYDEWPREEKLMLLSQLAAKEAENFEGITVGEISDSLLLSLEREYGTTPAGIRYITYEIAKSGISEKVEKYAENGGGAIVLGGDIEDIEVEKSFKKSWREDAEKQCARLAQTKIKPPAFVSIIPDDTEERLKERVFGQDEYIEDICAALKNRFNRTRKSRSPLTFFAMGSTGIGKTETFEQLANVLKQSGDWGYIKIKLDQFVHATSVTKLTGADPGYIGYGEKTQLDALNDHRYNIVVFDEFEKAHPDVWQIIMGMIGERPVYHSKYYSADIGCGDTVFAFTSNVAFERQLYKALPEGDRAAFLRETLINELSAKGDISVTAPLIGRIRDFFCFNPYDEWHKSDREKLFEKLIKEEVEDFEDIELEFVDRDTLESFGERYKTVPTGIRFIKSDLKNSGIAKAMDDFIEGGGEGKVKVSGVYGNLVVEKL